MGEAGYTARQIDKTRALRLQEAGLEWCLRRRRVTTCTRPGGSRCRELAVAVAVVGGAPACQRRSKIDPLAPSPGGQYSGGGDKLDHDWAAEYFALAVPELARQLDPVTGPCVVTGHFTAPGRGQAPGGPKGRAKAFLDALHDGRRTRPRYHDIGSCPPLAGDDPVHLAGLALEVAAGHARTEYLIGDQLRVRGELLAEVPVNHPAPNDIAGSRQEQAAISDSRTTYGRAVRAAFRCCRANRALLSSATTPSVMRTTPGRRGSQRSSDRVPATRATGLRGIRSADGSRRQSPASPAPQPAPP